MTKKFWQTPAMSERVKSRCVLVPNIFNVWADEGWKEPVIEERFDQDRTVLALSFKKSCEKNDDIN